MRAEDSEPIVRRVAFLFAMEVEGRQFATRLGMVEQGRLDPDLPATWLSGESSGEGDDPLVLAAGFAGSDEVEGCDCIGTNAATLTAYLLCRRFKPDLLVNAGTCGGFHQRGAQVGDVYLGCGAYLFHDRQIPLAQFEGYGVGRIPALPAGTLCEVLDAKPGVVSSGDSFTSNSDEQAFFIQEEVVAKEMEAAAIARVARDLKVPFLTVKAVTDLVDHPDKQSADMFEQNLKSVTRDLGNRLVTLVDWLGKGQRIRDIG